MDQQVVRLVDKAWAKFLKSPPDRRFLIAIAGIPGSGKTTLAQLVTSKLNAYSATLYPGHAGQAKPPIAAVVPMDGFHYTRAHLSSMPDPENAHARRGAAFTFDAAAFLVLVKALSQPLTEDTGTIYAPSFDHAVKDPRENDIPILLTHRIVVFEGLYLALDRPPWRDAAALMNQLWFVEVDFEVARARLIQRHIAAGICANEEEADKRATENDLLNGEELVAHRLVVDEVVTSIADGNWVHE